MTKKDTITIKQAAQLLRREGMLVHTYTLSSILFTIGTKQYTTYTTTFNDHLHTDRFVFLDQIPQIIQDHRTAILNDLRDVKVQSLPTKNLQSILNWCGIWLESFCAKHKL
jgi:hypothetical protein